jgi:chitinase
MATLDSPSYNRTQILGTPFVSASANAVEEIALYLRLNVTFGIVFEDRWDVPNCSVDFILDGYIIFYAEISFYRFR